MSGQPRLRLHVTPEAENAVRQGHPWVYANRIREQNRMGEAGDLAALYDRRNRFLALGLFDPESVLRVRVLHVGDPVKVDAEWWEKRLQAALARRVDLFDEQTTGWRCVHGESDGWPGLVLDRYGDVLVMKLYSVAWLPRLPELVPLLSATFRPRSLVLRLSRNVAEIAARDFHRQEGELLLGEPLKAPVVFLEFGLKFEAEVVRGQKTGFFLDQRENRRLAGALAKGLDVLNCFSFSGGFSVHAARGGARTVVDLDLSAEALEGARRNFALNRDIPAVAACRHSTVRGDTFNWLARKVDRQFDLVILDPPSLARREKDRAGAIAAYTRLAQLATRWVREGGVLLASSCSAQVGREDFFRAIHQGICRDGRHAVELQTTTHPADHPAAFPEAHYLKAIYLRVLSAGVRETGQRARVGGQTLRR